MTLLEGLLTQSLLNRYPDDDDRDCVCDVCGNQTVQSAGPKRTKTAQIRPSSGCHIQSKRHLQDTETRIAQWLRVSNGTTLFPQ